MKYSNSWIYDNYTRPMLDEATSIISKDLDEMSFDALKRVNKKDEPLYYVTLPKEEMLQSLIKTPDFPVEELKAWLKMYGWRFEFGENHKDQEVIFLYAITPEKD